MRLRGWVGRSLGRGRFVDVRERSPPAAHGNTRTSAGATIRAWNQPSVIRRRSGHENAGRCSPNCPACLPCILDGRRSSAATILSLGRSAFTADSSRSYPAHGAASSATRRSAARTPDRSSGSATRPRARTQASARGESSGLRPAGRSSRSAYCSRTYGDTPPWRRDYRPSR